MGGLSAVSGRLALMPCTRSIASNFNKVMRTRLPAEGVIG